MSRIQDIDGLRGAAALAVLLYHVKMPGFGAGYLGVDVFFVISGYFTSAMLFRLHATGERRWVATFLRNRIRRLAPALLATAIATFIVAALVFTSEDFAAVATATIMSLAQVANIYFWSISGYFDTSSIVKPLLHYWSLSVESQFYILAIMMFFALRKLSAERQVLVLIVGAAAVSILSYVAAESSYTMSSFGSSFVVGGESFVFFLTPFRLMEFAIGAILHRLEADQSLLDRIRLIRASCVTSVCGIALVFGAAWASFGGASFVAVQLLLCLGVFAIFIGRGSVLSSVLFTNRIILYLGRVSYSLYLVHWPVIVFYAYIYGEGFDHVDRTILLAFSVLFGSALHFGVENILRVKRRRSGPVLGGLAFTMSLAVSATSVGDEGWRWRVPGAPTTDLSIDQAPCGYVGSIRCVLGRGEGPEIVWVGDSVVQHFIPALRASPRRHLMISRGGCPMLPGLHRRRGQAADEACDAVLAEALRELDARRGATFVWTAAWGNYLDPDRDLVLDASGSRPANPQAVFSAAIVELSQRALRAGVRLILLDQPVFPKFFEAYRCASRPFEACSPREFDEPMASLRSRSPFFSNPGYTELIDDKDHFVDVAAALCRDSGSVCRLFESSGDLLFRDVNHFTSVGALRAIEGSPILSRLVL